MKKKFNEPLSSGYMLISMIGFIISAFMLEAIPSWAFAFMIVFIVMFISSVISMSNVPMEYLDLLDELNIHDPLHFEKRKHKNNTKIIRKSSVRKKKKK